jgi:sugar/nucleoside kinase (ribokinase family)
VIGRIACVGEIMLDVFVTATERHVPIRVRPGGTPVNAARAAGDSAVVVGRIGDDAAGAAIRAQLPGARLALDPELPTGTYVELADGTVYADRGANAALALEDVLPLHADAILLSGYVDLPVLEHVDSHWRAVVATPLMRAVPKGANVVFANDEEARRLELDGYEIVVVTHGAAGAEVRRDGTVTQLPPSGDTGTGAGDAFAGRFLASLL